MRIKKLELKNFRCFENLVIDFPSENKGLAVFVGVNGAGKTAILEGVSIALKTIQNELMPRDQYFDLGLEKNQVRIVAHQLGSKVSFEKQLQNGFNATAYYNKKKIEWHYHQGGGSIGQIGKLATELKNNIQKNTILPIIAFYKTSRYWTDEKSEKIEPYPSTSRLETYRDCLDPKTSTKILFEWFKRMKYIQLDNDGEVPPELKSVRNSIIKTLKILLNTKKKISVKFEVRSNQLIINYGSNNWLPFEYMSEGYRNLLGLIADIAYRCAELNPHKTNATPGIVLIDEPDLHLHPAWQRRIIIALQKVFPNIQFIVTTHSPQVLSNVPRENVFILNNFKLEKQKPHTEGRDSNAILEDVFDVPSRPEEEKNELDELFNAIEKGEKQKAQKLYTELKNKLGDRDLELQRAENYMDVLID